MSDIAKRVHRRLDALERAAKLVEKWRKDAVKASESVYRLGEDSTLNQCASELQEALEGK